MESLNDVPFGIISLKFISKSYIIPKIVKIWAKTTPTIGILKSIMNRQIGVVDSKYVVNFVPSVTNQPTLKLSMCDYRVQC